MKIEKETYVKLDENDLKNAIMHYMTEIYPELPSFDEDAIYLTMTHEPVKEVKATIIIKS